MLRNNGKIQHGSHWLQWFLELRLLQKTAMLLTSRKREVDLSIKKKKMFRTPARRSRTADLRIAAQSQLQSSALPTELSRVALTSGDKVVKW